LINFLSGVLEVFAKAVHGVTTSGNGDDTDHDNGSDNEAHVRSPFGYCLGVLPAFWKETLRT